ncbi:hypothetical protein C5167_000607 [Papaver somniferum]|uniref:Endoglucanase n=1 Tax=Papaver somniferum TaxID=3469 RepID=A0A4Y7KX34_PAPSO|nr:endoglucanase 8-like [Papaver somniferum]RZC76485.1 hypothetical protein C5167_000607 [Papaver somniferum]
MGRSRLLSCSIVSMLLLVTLIMVMVNESCSARREFTSKNSKEANTIDYADALTKSILFFEGQRSGKLPGNQRMTWRKDSALNDGSLIGVDLSGGYYDAGDNIKFNFPMAFTTTILAWSILEFGQLMGPDLQYAMDAIKWSTDYFIKCTNNADVIYVQVGEPYSDHGCWDRPEDMDTDRMAYAINTTRPGSEVSAEMAAALAASSIVFKSSDPGYSKTLLDRATQVFNFANTYQGNYNDCLKPFVCPFYCDWSGFLDELAWGALWLYKATHQPSYLDILSMNIKKMKSTNYVAYAHEFGWDNKDAGINVLATVELLSNGSSLSNYLSNDGEEYRLHADEFVCGILPENPTSVNYSQGGLMHKKVGSNMQVAGAISFLTLVYALHLDGAQQAIQCPDGTHVTPQKMVSIAKSQVDYILGNNPLGMSYMVGYSNKFPTRIHHRASSMPSLDQHPEQMHCKDGTPYFETSNPNPNLLIGAVVGGPDMNDQFADARVEFTASEPTTYINAPLTGLFAYFAHNT